MKRKVVALLLGGALAAVAFGANAQAMTYAYDTGASTESLSEEENRENDALYSDESESLVVIYSINEENAEADTGEITFSIDESIGEISIIKEDDDISETGAADQADTVVEVAAGSGFEEDNEEWKMTREEYEAVGITYDGASGSWMWQGKPVRLLMDEKGSMYQNGSGEAKENKIYILVTRAADGSIDTVKQVTMEEVLKEQILRDAE